MSKLFFNISGPCVPGEHYMLDPLRGIDYELTDLIDQRQYFIIHAARQSGKTTLLWELVRNINAKGDYYALYCSLEAIQELTDPQVGIPAVVKKIGNCVKEQRLPDGFAKEADYSDFTGVLKSTLVDYCRSLDKPLILLFDEADCLSNGTLITFLRQLRDGFVSRGMVPFVSSIALVGMRNIRDYKASIRPDSATLGSASPFNIVKKSLNLRNFTHAEVVQLYGQHTAQTGQGFEPQAIDYAFEQTQGQPWLVNAIATEIIEEILKKDYTKPITKDLLEQAIQNIILARGTHFDSLMERLKEGRVRRVIEPLILGEEVVDMGSDDYLYTRDLGLIREIGSKTEPANPIYAELIIRALNWNVQNSIKNAHTDYTVPRYMKNGKIDMDFLINDFQQYWRENSEIWKRRYKIDFYEYEEAAPHLIIQAFLQRVVNGGGKVIREMALGKDRADLCVLYDGLKYPVELKILRDNSSVPDGLKQLSGYMDKVGSDTGWLVVFDRDTEKAWEEKIYLKKESVNGKEITVAGC
ncbi:MAG: ATP-binding protein [Chitinispirillales bacterium]|nr:ATP-binding protein [Chitinispirillales bacterium]